MSVFCEDRLRVFVFSCPEGEYLRFRRYESTVLIALPNMTIQAMSVIQKLYPSVERRLKDYIAHPKQNGYQSLHATQLVPDGSSDHGPPVVIEFQVISLRHKCDVDETIYLINGYI